MVLITKTFLPPPEEYQAYLSDIWERSMVTNNGPLVQELEAKLAKYLGVKHLVLVNNGTIAIQIALKAAGITGKVITTPFSYVATTSSLVWEGCEPVFADIDPETLCIDPAEVEKLIDEETTAIMPTHVFGNICDVDALQRIADRHGVRLIYDAAHSFHVRHRGRSVLQRGDASILSLHATKLYHTIEGGAICTEDDVLAEQLRLMRNFGHSSPFDFDGVGINGKLSEFHAAMGLCLLPRVDDFIRLRREISERYKLLMEGLPISYPRLVEELDYNYAYFPSLFPSEEALLKAEKALNAKDIFPRRYFYPALNSLDYVTPQPCPVAEGISRRVLCLPLHPYLESEVVETVCTTIRESLQS